MLLFFSLLWSSLGGFYYTSLFYFFMDSSTSCPSSLIYSSVSRFLSFNVTKMPLHFQFHLYYLVHDIFLIHILYFFEVPLSDFLDSLSIFKIVLKSSSGRLKDLIPEFAVRCFFSFHLYPYMKVNSSDSYLGSVSHENLRFWIHGE